MAKKAAPKAKKAVNKKAAPAKKPAAKKAAPAKKVEVKKTSTESTVSLNPEQKTPTTIDHNDFLKLKIAKSMHENPSAHHSDEEVVEHEPLTPIVRETPKVGRNEPCPCGSGLKYKKCHGK